MRPWPLLPYLTGLCLAAATVVVLDAGAASRATTVEWPRGGVVPEPTRPAPSARIDSLRTTDADLPGGLPFPQRGSDTFRVVPGSLGPAGGVAYSVEVEDGVRLPQGDDSFAAVVDLALLHPRGWRAHGYAFRRVDHGEPALRIRLTSQDTARARCGFELPYDTSCRTGSVVYVSAARWFRGAHAFGRDLRGYRFYAVNHEVGHFLGRGHEVCPVDGGPAPLMMQQTLSTANDELAAIVNGTDQGVLVVPDGKACTANPWP
ncbi:DUF3152 domain-containing protein [Saccharothrix longispora]|uniref:DUF3152 domain-containing protein n=1 Tax=Saccharothrix longispora TaxID=33920 RepID=UPI0028FD4E07|nr:DUF3152 domain-containing protein [Saccharothrix longispora]MDU0292131.1 DUF3152 domain-containing protein [Saccharothrix longispora]